MILRHFRFLGILPAGMVGGSICAFFILSFGALIGRSGNTGEEYVGYWSPAYIGLAAIYGSLIGIIFYPVGHLLFLSQLTTRQLLLASWKIALVTIVLGCAGALHSPPVAVPTGLAGFFIGCGMFRSARNI